MDKTNHNTDATAVGAAMEEAAEAKEAEATVVTETKAPWKTEEYILDVAGDAEYLDYQGIAIYGAHLVSTKFLNVVKHLIMSDEFHKEEILDSIVFSENQPVDKDGDPIYACYKPELKRIGINLQQHFDGAEILVKEIDGFMSMRGHIWYNILLSVLHELYHGMFISTDKEAEMDMSELEETCNEMADDALTALAREFDIEPAAMADEPFFGPRYMQFFIREIQKGEGEWCARQLALHDDIHIHYDDKTKEYIQKFRTFMRFTHGGDMEQKDPRWDAEMKPLNILFQDDADVEAAEMVPVADAKPAASSLVGGQGVDDEALAMSEMDDEMRGDSNAYVMEDYDMLPAEAVDHNIERGKPVERVQKTHVAEAAPAVAQPPVSLERAQAHPDPIVSGPYVKEVFDVNAFCTECGCKLIADMKFCGGCGTSAAQGTGTASRHAAAQVQETVSAQAPVASYTQPPHRGAPGQQLQTGLVNHNWEIMRFRSIVESILFRAYTHLFNKCGYSIMANPAFDNNQKWGVLEPVYVGDLPDMDKVLIGHDTFENNLNRINVPITDGYIRGFITKGGMLPCYTLYFNANGDEIKRVLLPTNPWKQKAGAYSKPALRAQQGAIIAWIMDGDDHAVDNKWRGRIEDSIFIWS